VSKGKLWLQRTDAIISPRENENLRNEKGVAKDIE
jgi:hypothetical protein